MSDENQEDSLNQMAWDIVDYFERNDIDPIDARAAAKLVLELLESDEFLLLQNVDCSREN